MLPTMLLVLFAEQTYKIVVGSSSNSKELNVVLGSGVIEQVSERNCSVGLILDSRKNVGTNYNSQQNKLH